MTIEETRKRILEDNEFVLEETRKLQYLYQLKGVIRSDLTRAEDDVTESVADHLYGLQVLVQYFRRLEPAAENLDDQRVSELIFAHDLGELETGDVSANFKTDADRKREQELFPNVLIKSPAVLAKLIEERNTEYELQESHEARFVKAVDKLEPMLQFYNDSHRPVFESLQFTEEDLDRTKLQYVETYPLLFRFYDVLRREFREGKFFYEATE